MSKAYGIDLKKAHRELRHQEYEIYQKKALYWFLEQVDKCEMTGSFDITDNDYYVDMFIEQAEQKDEDSYFNDFHGPYRTTPTKFLLSILERLKTEKIYVTQITHERGDYGDPYFHRPGVWTISVRKYTGEESMEDIKDITRKS